MRRPAEGHPPIDPIIEGDGIRQVFPDQVEGGERFEEVVARDGLVAATPLIEQIQEGLSSVHDTSEPIGREWMLPGRAPCRARGISRGDGSIAAMV
jgi:hypothetical protein